MLKPKVLSLILGGGRGARLFPLTKHRSKPAMPVAGKYRLIDIPISNCINSGMTRIYVLTQFLSVSLHRHIANTYKFDMFGNGFVEILAAQQTNEAADWYQGTADAVRQNLRYIMEDGCEYVVILSGDQLYRMDFSKLIDTHVQNQAQMTIAVLPVAEDKCREFGLVRLNEAGRVTGFVEKPKTAEERGPFFTSAEQIEKAGIGCHGRHFLASMGIYVFNRDTLLKVLKEPPLATDFGKEIFPRSIRAHHIHAHLFDGYWEDLGTVKSYHEASLALASDSPPFEFTEAEGVIYTRMRFLPAARAASAVLEQSLLSDGCVLSSGVRLERCVLGVRARVGFNTLLRDTVVIGSDRFETDAERAQNRVRGVPNFNIGDNCVIHNAILDKDCRVGNNVRITNERGVQDVETERYCVRDGIVVIPRGVMIPDNTVI